MSTVWRDSSRDSSIANWKAANWKAANQEAAKEFASQEVQPPAIKSEAKMWFTDHMLFQSRRCRRRTYLDTYGDPGLKDPPSDYFVKLRQDSADHRQSLLSQFAPLSRPTYDRYDWEAGAITTHRLMSEGADAIHRGVLIGTGPNDTFYRTEPDLLIKQPGESWLGDWYYVPYTIKLGKKQKPEYQLVATFSAYLLAELQGVWPETAWLFLKEKQYSVNLERYVPKLQEALDDCHDIMAAPGAPEVFISRNRCSLCPWLSHCYATAKSLNHLSLLPGVTLTRYPTLVDLGLTTVEALAAANVTRLTDALGTEHHISEKLIHQAQATARSIAIPRLYKGSFPLAPHQVPTTDIELYFDIEAAPDKDLIYLHGVLVIDRKTEQETFHALLAETPEDEAKAWFEFLMLVNRYPDAPIYHFCPYEAQTVSRLGQLYGTNGTDINALLKRFVDIHKRIVDAVALPVESYALKHLARWMGFEWRDEDANGAQSICWYDDWLATGDRIHLDTILRYNEDDCQATYRVKDWLVKFSQPFWD
ncbi:MAG: TM0106 family RecB-like putative nuclease [Phormidesmis sp.]